MTRAPGSFSRSFWLSTGQDECVEGSAELESAGSEGVLMRCMRNDHSKATNVMTFVLYFTNSLTFSAGLFYNMT
jgi:hypothetical protein